MIKKLHEALLKFIAERDWGPHHTPKTMAIAFSCEVAELMELFISVSDSDSFLIQGDAVEEEIGDVMNCFIWTADSLQMPIEILEVHFENHQTTLQGSPKDQLLLLGSKVGRFVEHFLWKDPDENRLASAKLDLMELFALFLSLSKSLSIDPLQAGWKKHELNERKYPAIIVKDSIDAYFAQKKEWEKK